MIAVAGFAGTAILTRLLPPEQVGIYFIAFAAATLAGPLANISLREPTVRGLAAALAVDNRPLASAIARRSLTLGVMCSFCVAVLLSSGWAIIAQLGLHVASQYYDVGYLVAVWIGILGIENQLVGTLQGLEHIRDAVALDGALGRLIAVAGLTALWLSPSRGDIYIVLIIFVGAELLSVGVAFRRVHKVMRDLGVPSDLPLFSDLWSAAWPFLLHQVTANAAAQADVFVLGLFTSPLQVAVYGTASRLAGLPSIPVAALNVPIAPYIARLHAEKRISDMQRLLQNSAAAFTLIALIASLIWVTTGHWVLRNFFGEVYQAGFSLLLILGFGLCLNVYLGQCMLALAMSGGQKKLTKIAVLSSLIKVLLLLPVGAALLGSVGVATASIIGNTIALAAGWWTVRRLLGIVTHARWPSPQKTAG